MIWGEHSISIFRKIIECIAIIAIIFLAVFGYKNYKIQHSNASNRIKSQANYSQEIKSEENKATNEFEKYKNVVMQTANKFKTGINTSGK